MATIVTRAGKGSPLTNNEVDANFENLNADKLESSSYTASDVLTKIKTVDGTGSGLDADLLDGNQATAFATAAQGALADSAIQPGDVSEITAAVRHSIRPSLLLDFANSKQLDPRITFSRASTGTYYDGKTFAKAEENLFRYSQEFDQSSTWTLGGATVTADNTTAPDGTITADEIIEASGSTTRLLRYIGSFAIPNGIATVSAYFKAGSGTRYPYILYSTQISSNVVFARAIFNLSAGTVSEQHTETNGSLEPTILDASITNVGNGWYRCTLSFEDYQTSGTQFCWIGLSNVSSSPTDDVYGRITYTGDGSSGIYIWGAQVEQRSSVTAYTPTTSQPITNYIPVLQTAAAGTARFDHDPVTGESKGLLIEEQRTNLLTYSEDFSNAVWTKYASNSISTNLGVAPDGTQTADQFSLVTSSSSQGFYAFFSASAITYTHSIYVKPLDSHKFFALSGFDGKSTSYNLSTMAVSSGEGGTSTGTIVDVGNGWYRLTRTVTATAGSQYPALIAIPSYPRVGGSTTWTPTTPARTLIWGAQLEAGAFPTSYIKTTSAQATRNADTASMTGTNFSSWYRQDEWSICLDVTTWVGGAACFGNSYSANIELVRNNTYSAGIYTSGIGGVTMYYPITSTPSYPVSTYVPNQNQRYALALKANEQSFGYMGNSSTGTAANAPSLASFSGFYFGSNIGPNSNKYTGYIKTIKYYPVALTSAELAALTEA
jgi:hypothetical protein